VKLSLLTNDKTFTAIKKLMEQPLPVKSAFKLKNTVKVLDQHLANFHEVRTTRLKQLGAKNEDGTPQLDEKGGIVLLPENLAIFSAEITALLEEEIDVALLSIDELAGCSLSGEDMLALDGFVV